VPASYRNDDRRWDIAVAFGLESHFSKRLQRCVRLSGSPCRKPKMVPHPDGANTPVGAPADCLSPRPGRPCESLGMGSPRRWKLMANHRRHPGHMGIHGRIGFRQRHCTGHFTVESTCTSSDATGHRAGDLAAGVEIDVLSGQRLRLGENRLLVQEPPHGPLGVDDVRRSSLEGGTWLPPGQA
jgi:hypothetical protein